MVQGIEVRLNMQQLMPLSIRRSRGNAGEWGKSLGNKKADSCDRISFLKEALWL
ncbi:MAG: hypothetical protein RL563_2590 [Pseudomonadota bacterium]